MNIGILVVCICLGLASYGVFKDGTGDLHIIIYAVTIVLLLFLLLLKKNWIKAVIGIFFLLVSFMFSGGFKNTYVFQKNKTAEMQTVLLGYVDRNRQMMAEYTQKTIDARIYDCFQKEIIGNLDSLQRAYSKLMEHKKSIDYYHTLVISDYNVSMSKFLSLMPQNDTKISNEDLAKMSKRLNDIFDIQKEIVDTALACITLLINNFEGFVIVDGTPFFSNPSLAILYNKMTFSFNDLAKKENDCRLKLHKDFISGALISNE